MMHDTVARIHDRVHEAYVEIRKLQDALAESQAREAALVEAVREAVDWMDEHPAEHPYTCESKDCRAWLKQSHRLLQDISPAAKALLKRAERGERAIAELRNITKARNFEDDYEFRTWVLSRCNFLLDVLAELAQEAK